MIATFQPCRLQGRVEAPPSKSMAHRYLIGAALSGEICRLSGIDYSEDILATIACLRGLGAQITMEGNRVTVDPSQFMHSVSAVLPCGESGSTLRFFLPLALCLGREMTLQGSQRLMERPLDVYRDLCREQGFVFQQAPQSVTVCGQLKSGTYTLRGDSSSQFITGLLFALVYLGEDACIEILPPFESRSYVDLTIAALSSFGIKVSFADAYHIRVQASPRHGFSGRIEGDYSNAAFLDAFNYTGSQVAVDNLNPHSLQGDRVYAAYFSRLAAGTPTLDLTDCPDLGPVLFALAALQNGATFTGTRRLKDKESDRVAAMHAALQKLGGGLVIGENTVTVPAQTLRYTGDMIDGHNDHRIVMAMAVILTRIGGSIRGAEAVCKSYPGFFEDIQRLGAAVELV